MINTSDLHRAIIDIHPQVVLVREDIAYDSNGNTVEYNLAEAQAHVEVTQSAKQAASDSATSKLKALGLTDDEISALKGTL
jgi:hypothetical protein